MNTLYRHKVSLPLCTRAHFQNHPMEILFLSFWGHHESKSHMKEMVRLQYRSKANASQIRRKQHANMMVVLITKRIKK